MKTLRDERARLFGPSHPANETYSPAVGPHFDMEHRFFAKYGSWQVVEGVLMTKHRGVVLVENPSDDGGCKGWHTLGALGDRVKLGLPPEEKVGGPNWEVRCKNERELKRIHRARADKFEKALRQIARPAVEDRNVYSAYHRRTRIAREALDDTDS